MRSRRRGPFLVLDDRRLVGQSGRGGRQRERLGRVRHEAYAELNVPIFRDQPFAESLELSLAGRYSDYSTVGNKVTRALLRLEREPEEWQVTLKAADFSLGSLKTPKIESAGGNDADPDALFLEKMYLIESCLELVDILYKDFLRIRLDNGADGWPGEVKRLREWMRA